MKKYLNFLSEKFQFLEIKFSIYMNRRVFIMLGKNFSRRYFEIHFLIFQASMLWHSCELSTKETIRDISAELIQRVVKINSFSLKTKTDIIASSVDTDGMSHLVRINTACK